MKKNDAPSHSIFRKITQGITIFFLFILLLVLIGVFLPTIPYIGEAGTLLVTFISIHLLLVSIILFAISYWVYHKHRNKLTLIILILYAFSIFGFLIPVVTLITTAQKYNTPLSWSNWLKVQFELGEPNLEKSVKYAHADGKDLFMDVSYPDDAKNLTSLTPLVFIHGGGFVSGDRNQEPGWVKFYTDKGFVVFDVQYRLAKINYPTWNKAAPDVASAITYIGNNSEKYHVNMDKLIIAGSSAGASLALQVAYGLRNGAVKPYIEGMQYKPQLVVALYPAADISYLWHKNLSFFGMKTTQIGDTYIGGSPEKFPKAYQITNVLENITPNDPPTLIISGKADHLIPYELQKSLADKLQQEQIPFQFVALPYNDHFFTMAAGSIGNQIAFKVASDFLDKYK